MRSGKISGGAVSYEVIGERMARKAVARLPQAVYDRVMRAIEDIADDPRPRQSRRLHGSRAPNDDTLEVFVAEGWHRQRGYR
jgi:hypothetical protein